jgi:DNA-binding NarL/FixJ family response regulator
MNSIRVLLAEPDALVRSALTVALAQVQGLEIVGQASDMGQVLASIADLHPNVLLLAWELPGGAPEALVALLARVAPGLRVIALSARPEARKAALVAGVHAFVSKVEPPERLLQALNLCTDLDA